MPLGAPRSGNSIHVMDQEPVREKQNGHLPEVDRTQIRYVILVLGEQGNNIQRATSTCCPARIILMTEGFFTADIEVDISR